MHVLQILLDGVRAACADFPDKRRGGLVTHSMSDIGLSAFSLIKDHLDPKEEKLRFSG